jgi:hypothetical protein
MLVTSVARPENCRPTVARWIIEGPVIRPQSAQVGLERSDFQQPDFGTACSLSGTSYCETSGLLRFDPSGFDDTRRAFTLAQNKTRELRLCHAHGISPMLRKLVAQIGRS